jgi:hypothetical protein
VLQTWQDTWHYTHDATDIPGHKALQSHSARHGRTHGTTLPHGTTDMAWHKAPQSQTATDMTWHMHHTFMWHYRHGRTHDTTLSHSSTDMAGHIAAHCHTILGTCYTFSCNIPHRTRVSPCISIGWEHPQWLPPTAGMAGWRWIQIARPHRDLMHTVVSVPPRSWGPGSYQPW